MNECINNKKYILFFITFKFHILNFLMYATVKITCITHSFTWRCKYWWAQCDAQPVMLSLWCSACDCQPVMLSLWCSACDAQHVMISLWCSACDAQPEMLHFMPSLTTVRWTKLAYYLVVNENHNLLWYYLPSHSILSTYKFIYSGVLLHIAATYCM